MSRPADWYDEMMQFFYIDVPTTDWYDEMMQFFYTGLFPSTFSRDQRKRLALQSRHYKVIADQLYRIGGDGLLRRCVPPHETNVVLAEAHQGIGTLLEM